MSRRDTIIVSVLINTGLLAALFMMAVHKEIPQIASTPESFATSPTVTPTEEMRFPESSKEGKDVAVRDEIDEVLVNYSKENTSQTSVSSGGRPLRNVDSGNESETRRFPLSSSDEQFVEVTVKKGDYLEKIARANGTTVTAIIRANQLSNARIDVGQTLKVPVARREESISNPPLPTAREVAAVEEPQYYTIKSGDNPWKIAKQFHVKFDDLLKLNGLDEAKARNLKPGDVLRVK